MTTVEIPLFLTTVYRVDKSGISPPNIVLNKSSRVILVPLGKLFYKLSICDYSGPLSQVFSPSPRFNLAAAKVLPEPPRPVNI
jgi:hypothetical protein